jgi:hypothetical protein
MMGYFHREKQAVSWYRQQLVWCGSLLCLLVCLGLQGRVDAQGGPPRPSRRGVLSPTAPGNPATEQPPQPLSQETKISLDQSGLSVDVQAQDLPAVVERIAALGQIDIRHPEGLPHRRVSIHFSSLPVVDGLKRLFRVAEVPGYMLVMAPDNIQVQRIVFLAEEWTSGASAARGGQRAPQVAAAQPPPPGSIGVPPPPAAPPQTERSEEPASGNVFDDIKSNAAARRLLSQMMHPNEQVRERAFEGLVRIVREDDKQRALMEFFEPLMDDLGSEDQATQDGAREEIRKLLTR